MYEINAHMGWFNKQDDATWHKIAVMSSIIIQPHFKKAIRPEDLIKIGGDVRKVPAMTPEQKKSELNRLIQTFERRTSGKYSNVTG